MFLRVENLNDGSRVKFRISGIVSTFARAFGSFGGVERGGVD